MTPKETIIQKLERENKEKEIQIKNLLSKMTQPELQQLIYSIKNGHHPT